MSNHQPPSSETGQVLLRCNDCKTSKPEEDFYRCTSRKTGRQGMCISCLKIRHRVIEKARSERYTADLPGYLWVMAKRRAKVKGLEFTITPEDISVPDTCPYLGIPIFRRNDGTARPCANSPSLDRIDPSLGYVPGNVRVISHRANAMKYSASTAELVFFAKAILRLHSS